MTGLLLTGCGVALGSVDLTWRCVIMACRRSLSFASCNEERERIKFFMNNREKKLFSIFLLLLIPYIPLALKASFKMSVFEQIDLLLLRPSNYLFSKCFWKLSTTPHFRQSNYCLKVKVKRYCASLPITSPGPFYLSKTQRCLSCQLKLWW